MTKSSRNRYKNNPGGGRYAALALLAVTLIAVGGYLLSRHHTEAVKQPPPSPPVVRNAPLPPAQQQEQAQYERAPQPEIASTQETTTGPATSAPIPDARPRAEKTSGKAQMAIIIDDMGSSMQEARKLAGIGVPLTFSIIPGLHSYKDVAAFATSSGIETMIHIPMQSKGWPQRRLEANGLLLSMDDADITAHLDDFIKNIPHAIGANNHMGSEFTEHRDKMQVVLEALKPKGLFFIDSMTSPRSVGKPLAVEMGMKSGRRDVFLDNEQDGAYIRGQLNQAVRLARKRGASIAICHPHPITIKTLAALLPGLENKGVTLVPASRLVR